MHTIIMAQILGLYLVIVAIIMLLRVDLYRQFFDLLKVEKGAVIMSSCFSLILGLFMLVIHNLWVWQPKVLITIIAWWIVIKSILWLSLPEKMAFFTQKIFSGKAYYVIVVIAALIGVWLLIYGFSRFL